MARRQGVYWILTIPRGSWSPYETLPDGIACIRGQAEIGEGGYEHWQLLVVFSRKQSLHGVKRFFTVDTHAELTVSRAAYDYVWKEDTRVDGTQFELGTLPFKRNEPKDWDRIWALAKSGSIEEIPADTRICHYSALRRIASDYSTAVAIERTIHVFVGPPGTGKSRRAWEEAGLDAYPKDPRSKFWDGYQGEEKVVIDEFRGGIDIAHILRWFDRYPVRVEIKGASCVLRATGIWVTSNLHPSRWYPELDGDTYGALLRRMSIVEFE